MDGRCATYPYGTTNIISIGDAGLLDPIHSLHESGWCVFSSDVDIGLLSTCWQDLAHTTRRDMESQIIISDICIYVYRLICNIVNVINVLFLQRSQTKTGKPVLKSISAHSQCISHSRWECLIFDSPNSNVKDVNRVHDDAFHFIIRQTQA